MQKTKNKQNRQKPNDTCSSEGGKERAAGPDYLDAEDENGEYLLSDENKSDIEKLVNMGKWGLAHDDFAEGRVDTGFIPRNTADLAPPPLTTEERDVILAAAALSNRDFVERVSAVPEPAASIGVWMFFIQHQFEQTSWSSDEEWDWHEAALYGSSNYHLPPILRWMSGNVGLHSVHHLCSRIPYYRLPEVVRDHPELAAIGRLGIVDSLSCVRLTLWDESTNALVTFSDARAA